VATIGSRFSTEVGGQVVRGIPPLPPLPGLPWGEGGLSFATLRALVPAAFAIAMLGAIESLLSAVIADAMTGKKHDPDAELVGLGIGNIVAPFFGGIAATGALARTATNVRSGAVSPFAATFHALVVLLAILLFAPLVAYIPMASLAGLLLLVAWNMSEVRHFAHTARVAPRSDVLVLLSCYFLTVVFDMVIAVGAGVVLASLLFMRRMAELTSSRVMTGGAGPDTQRTLPDGVSVYEIAGPLFFGAAQKAMSAIESLESAARVVILDLSKVPAMDATGLVALESAIQRLHAAKKRIIVANVAPQPRSVLERAEVSTRHEVTMIDDLEQAIAHAESLLRRPSMAPMPVSKPA
jgi:SulP family sulfate permease